MHVAIFSDYYLPTLGGVQTSIKAQKDTLEGLGHKVTLFCPLHEPSSDPSVVQLPTSTTFKPDGYPFCWPPKDAIPFAEQYIRDLGDVDVIHCQSEMLASIAGAQAALKLGIPLVQTMHGRVDTYCMKVLPLPAITTWILAGLHKRNFPNDSHTRVALENDHYTHSIVGRRMWRLMVNQANLADHVLVPSQHFTDKLRKQGVDKPLTVLSNGLEATTIDRIQPAQLHQFDPGKEKLKVMWCGRISPEKRPLEFLKAIDQLSCPVEVNMYGAGPVMKKVHRFIHRHQLATTVHIHGSVPQDELITAMRENHVFVSTSYDFDNQPMVLLEAIASATPVIICDPDLAEIFPEAGGIVTKTPEPTDLAGALTELHARPERIKEMSAAMLAEQNRATQEQYTNQLLDIYASLLKKSQK